MTEKLSTKDVYREVATNYRNISTGQFTGSGLFILIVSGLVNEFLKSSNSTQATGWVWVILWVCVVFFVIVMVLHGISKNYVKFAAEIEKADLSIEGENFHPFSAKKPNQSFLRWSFCKPNTLLAVAAILSSLFLFVAAKNIEWPRQNNAVHTRYPTQYGEKKEFNF